MNIGIFFIILCVLLTVYSQIIIKNEIMNLGIMPIQMKLLLPYLLKAFTNVKILSGIFSAFLVMICWFGAVSRFDLGYAYPFMSLTFPLVVIFSIFLFHEPFYWAKIMGISLILLGLLIISIKI